MATNKPLDKNYFQHNYGARNELKILKLRSVHGTAGYGAYWELIEKLFENDGEMNLSDIPLFAYELHLDENGEKLLNSVINDFGLFEINEETGDFTADTVAKQLQFRKERSEAARAKVNKRYQKDEQAENEPDNEESTLDTQELSEKIMLFQKRFPNVVIDLNGKTLKRKMALIDIDRLTEAVNESEELQKITSLLVICDKYDRAIKGYYKDKPKTDGLTSAASVLSSIFPNMPK